MKRSVIPNTFTCLNLLCGCIGIVFSLRGEVETGSLFIWIAALFDFLDGFLARKLNAYSELGKQLDSLSDMVSFGVLPGMIMFQLMDQYSSMEMLQWIAFLIPVASALRLAKFNTDEEQTDSFKGLPTPASAILISGLPYLAIIPLSPLLLALVCLITSVLMVSSLPLMALKFKDFSWKKNGFRFTFLIMSLVTILFLGYQSISLIIVLYIFISLITFKKNRRDDSTGD